MYGHIRGLECCRRPPHTRLALHPSNGLPTALGRPSLPYRDNLSPRRRSQSRTDVRFVISLCRCAEYPYQGRGGGQSAPVRAHLFSISALGNGAISQWGNSRFRRGSLHARQQHADPGTIERMRMHSGPERAKLGKEEPSPGRIELRGSLPSKITVWS